MKTGAACLECFKPGFKACKGGSISDKGLELVEDFQYDYQACCLESDEDGICGEICYDSSVKERYAFCPLTKNECGNQYDLIQL